MNSLLPSKDVVYSLKGSIITTLSGYEKLCLFYRSLSTLKAGSVVILDFSELKWIDANLCAVVGSMLYKLERDQQLVFKTDLSVIDKNFDVLIRNGFIYNPAGNSSTNYQSTIKFAGFLPSDDAKFIQYIENDLLGHVAFYGRDILNKKDELIDHFCEVFANISLHAQTNEPFFACGQYFPTKKEVKFTIVDEGVGFLPPIQRFTNGHIQTAEEAIQWAITDTNTTKTDATGGLGLKQLLRYCKNTNGKMSILTGGSYWSSTKTLVRYLPEYCGSIINITFVCN